MPQSYDRIILHTVFGTKYRQPFIDANIEPQLYRIIISEFKRYNSFVHEIGGTADHVHIVHTLPRTEALADIIKEVKSVSSKWIKTKAVAYEWFSWQDGYASFSVDYRRRDDVMKYVRRQKQHHGITDERMGFRDEFARLMHAYEIDNYTPEYVFPERSETRKCKS